MIEMNSNSEIKSWQLMRQMWIVLNDIVDEVSPTLATKGLLPQTFFLLVEIQEHPFPAELSRALQLPPPTISYFVRKLEELGYLIRENEPTDLRRYRLKLTDSGRSALEEGQELIDRAADNRLLNFSEREKKELERMLWSLIQK